MSKKALWRQVEEMTPHERADFLEISAKIIIHKDLGTLRGWYGGDYADSHIIKHTPLWIKVRNSFYQSREWRTFRSSFLERHPLCVECGQKANVVHHIPPHNLDSTVQGFGFLFLLDYDQFFAAMCKDCNYEFHKELIIAEKEIKSE